MFHRKSVLRLRGLVTPLIFGLSAVLPGALTAQAPSSSAIPAPVPVPASSLPSMPPATAPQAPQTVPTPAQAPTPTAPESIPQSTPQASPQGTSPQTAAPGQQPYNNPLDQPVIVAPAPPAQDSPVYIAPPERVNSLPSIPTDYTEPIHQRQEHLGSTYIPVDDEIYPMALRLYSMGYLNTIFISMRPWTRRSLLHALEQSAPAIQADGNEQAQMIYAKLMDYLHTEIPGPEGTTSQAMTRGEVYGVENVYARAMGISGLTLRDSYHLGQTIANDYARPYEPGFNAVAGFSTVNEWNRFSLYVRGEYQHAPSAVGYSQTLSAGLSGADEINFVPPNVPQATIPTGPIAAVNPFRLQEAVVSVHLIGHEISGGKSDAWLGPAQGGAMDVSNNAENIYSFRINRVEPLHIPYFSYLFGGLRYDFFVGALQGHTFPRSPWMHSEMFSLRPTDNFEFSFERTVVWGGHCAACIVGPPVPGNPTGGIEEPVTLHTFLNSFFSFRDTENNPDLKVSRDDPGARFSDFSFSWRLPFLHRYVTLYTDSIVHDDVSPISAPRRASYRPGVYLSQFPGMPKLDLRVEGASTDCSTLACRGGVLPYFEAVQRQGPTNKGFLFGDPVGREGKLGQAWLTYHLSANEWVQLEYMHKKTDKDFIQSGTTQNQFKVDVVKRLSPNIELDAWFQYEHWAAPLYQTTQQTDTTTAVRIAFYPKLRTSNSLNGK